MIKLRKTTVIALFCTSFAAMFGPFALAQSDTANAQEIEEILVTATRREESIQDIPIAVSAFAGEDLDARGVQDLYGLQEVSPSISVYIQLHIQWRHCAHPRRGHHRQQPRS